MTDRPGGWIRTFSGLQFWPLDPRPEDIRIEDIAHALSQQCRFAGHARIFYSVAEHSVHVSTLCPPENALWGLLHDASEAYLQDVARPLKCLPEFAPYRAAERRLQDMIVLSFGLDADPPASVHDADDAMLQFESRALLTGGLGGPETAVRPAPAFVGDAPWPPPRAEQEFLARFRELTGHGPHSAGGGVR